VRDLNGEGFCATLDVLGEFIATHEEAELAVQVYLDALDRIDKESLDSNVSVKLTMLGLKLDEEFCYQNIRKLVHRAKELDNFVRIDMEDSTCTTPTLAIFGRLREEFDNVGFVVQSYMRRSVADIREQIQKNGHINVRVCKGIYIESRDIAYKDDFVINSNFMWLVEELLSKQHYVGIATHDPRLVWSAYKMIDHLQVDKTKFEFQMLLGVDEQLRKSILDAGYKLRVYVPYGKRWYDYSIRRLKENPKIAGHVIKRFFKVT